MGGLALRKYGIYTDRKSTEDFYKISNTLQSKLQHDLGVETFVPFFYREKETHGDLDLLFKMDSKYLNSKVNIKEYISKNFNTDKINNNGGIFSFAYDNFQVDIIPMKELYWKTARIYMSWDPASNIFGKIFHKFGLSYGWDGLKYKYRNFNGIVVEDILVSTDIEDILYFGGFDYDRYLLGFDKLEDIFEYIINSKYFTSDIFQMSALTRIDRKRNAKRKTYQQFLKYINENNITKNYIFDDKENYLQIVNDFFKDSDLINKIKILDKSNDLKLSLSEKFNGNLIMNIHPNLKGIELGKNMTNFKNSFESIDFYNDFILTNDFNTIMNEFNKINNL